MDVIFRFYMAHIYNNHNVIETVNNCMPFGSFLIFHGMVDPDVPHRNVMLILKSDNHFPVNSFFLLRRMQKTRGYSASRQILHRSVNFYFTVLSEPSQDSS